MPKFLECRSISSEIAVINSTSHLKRCLCYAESRGWSDLQTPPPINQLCQGQTLIATWDRLQHLQHFPGMLHDVHSLQAVLACTDLTALATFYSWLGEMPAQGQLTFAKSLKNNRLALYLHCATRVKAFWQLNSGYCIKSEVVSSAVSTVLQGPATALLKGCPHCSTAQHNHRCGSEHNISS